jgi:hypothetical protein
VRTRKTKVLFASWPALSFGKRKARERSPANLKHIEAAIASETIVNCPERAGIAMD